MYLTRIYDIYTSYRAHISIPVARTDTGVYEIRTVSLK